MRTLFERQQMERDRWLVNAAEEPPLHNHWKIMLILHENGQLKHGQISKKFGTMPRDDLAKIYPEMIEIGLIEKSDKEGGEEIMERTENRSPYYKLTEKARERYFCIDPQEIGTAKDIPAVTAFVVDYYLHEKGFFLTSAPQEVRKGKNRTDLVAYDYENQIPISVEIESAIEVDSHAEHVAKNMVKWPEMGFLECHVFSFNKKIEDIHKHIPEMQEFKNIPKDILSKVMVFGIDP